MITVDSHCHLTHFPDDEIPRIISRAEQNAVKVLHNICVSINDVSKMLKISSLYDCVYSSIGIHPLDCTVEQGQEIHLDKLIKLTNIRKVISIGETGLDYYKSNNKTNQKKSFELHIEMAKITGLPLVIHARNADKEIIDILRSEMKNRTFSGVVHSFASSRELAYQAIDLGFYISFSGIITFKKSLLLREIAQNIPRERILVETDAPYLSPEPYRGKRNEPAMLKHVIICLARLWNKPQKRVSEVTTKNFFRLFHKAQILKQKFSEI